MRWRRPGYVYDDDEPRQSRRETDFAGNWVAAMTGHQIAFKLCCYKSLVKLVKVNHSSSHLPEPHYILFFPCCGFVLCVLLLSSHLLAVMGVQYLNWRVISLVTWLLLSLNTSIYLSIYLSMALQPLLGPWPLFQFLISTYTAGRTPWTGDQSVARPLSAHRTAQTQNKRIHRHPCLKSDSNPRS
jgi:hypothetical protein